MREQAAHTPGTIYVGLSSILTVFHSFRVPRHMYYYALLLAVESKEQWTYFVMCHLCEPYSHLGW